MKKLVLDDEATAALTRLSHRHAKAYVRIKALALLDCAAGRSQVAVAASFQVTAQTIRAWCRRYLREGVSGLEVRHGRGRRAQADAAEIARYVQQSPRHFGLDRTRWTLALLSQCVPCLKGFSRDGTRQALRRAGFRYKRSQIGVHSPDPDYEVKKGLWTRR